MPKSKAYLQINLLAHKNLPSSTSRAKRARVFLPPTGSSDSGSEQAATPAGLSWSEKPPESNLFLCFSNTANDRCPYPEIWCLSTIPDKLPSAGGFPGGLRTGIRHLDVNAPYSSLLQQQPGAANPSDCPRRDAAVRAISGPGNNLKHFRGKDM